MDCKEQSQKEVDFLLLSSLLVCETDFCPSALKDAVLYMNSEIWKVTSFPAYG